MLIRRRFQTATDAGIHPFTELELLNRYESHMTYCAAVVDRSDRSVSDGFLLPEGAVDMLRRACVARFRLLEPTAVCPAYEPPAFRAPLDHNGSGNGSNGSNGSNGQVGS